MSDDIRPRADTPRYYRISPRFWKDEKVTAWGDDTKLLALHLLSSPHRTPEGIFVLPKSYLVADLNWRQRKIENSLTVLIQNGFVSFDSRTNVFLIRNSLKYQLIENNNQSIAVMRRIKELPNTPLLEEFLALTKLHCYRQGAGAAAQAFYQQLDKVLQQRLQHSLTLTPTLTRSIETPTLPHTPPAAGRGSDLMSPFLESEPDEEPEKIVGMGEQQAKQAKMVGRTTTSETHLSAFLREVEPMSPQFEAMISSIGQWPGRFPRRKRIRE